MPSIQKLNALLVGINEYDAESQKNGVKNLKGCVNDVNAMQALLLQEFDHLQPNIETLTNAQATRKNIIETFRSHLHQQADEHTTALFYFSGHGARQSTPEPFHKYIGDAFYRREETLVCHDSRNYKQKGLDLADKELAILIEELADKGVHVVIILDCCHSGSGTRSTAEDSEDVTIKEVEDRDPIYSINRRYLDNYYEQMLEAGKEPTVPRKSHILLSGCKRNQYSKEIKVSSKGTKRGAFTLHLEQTLQEYGTQISYANLYSAVYSDLLQADFQDIHSPQHPQFEPYGTFDTQDFFLQGIPASAQATLRKVRLTEGGTWVVDFGFAMALPTKFKQEIRFALYDAPQQGQFLGYATAARVKLNETDIILESPALLAGRQDCWARPINLLNERCKVRVTGDKALVKDFKATLSNSQSAYVETSKALFVGAPLKVHFDANEYQISYLRKRIPHRLVVGEANAQDAVDALERVARWDALLHASNANTGISDDEFEFYFVEGHQASGTAPKKPKSWKNQNIERHKIKSKKAKYYADYEKLWDVPYALVAKNTGNRKLFFTLFYFGSDYGIASPLPQEPMPANSTPLIFHDRLFPPDKGNEVFYFKLVVSTKEIKPYLYKQSGFSSKELRPIRNDPDSMVTEDWTYKTIELRVSR